MQIESLLEKVKVIGDKAKGIKLTIEVRSQLRTELKHPHRCLDCPLHGRDQITSIPAGDLIREALRIQS